MHFVLQSYCFLLPASGVRTRRCGKRLLSGCVGRLVLAVLALVTGAVQSHQNSTAGCITPVGALGGHRFRVVVCTDAGGTDPDDYQSLVHLFVYSDCLELEGIISSPCGSAGRKEAILKIIELYEKDYPKLRAWSNKYPTPKYLRSITKQGATVSAGLAGVGSPTEGSEWLIRCARRDTPEPLYVLVWGGLEDLAQALHDAPEILPRLRVYFIGGPNKMWSVNAYAYIMEHHPDLWMIEANSTYRGWFVGGEQTGDWGNKEFVTRYIKDRGAMGTFFESLLQGKLKMGDSPSVAWLLCGDPENPSAPGWGGQFKKIGPPAKTNFTRLTTKDDQVEIFGVVEFNIPLPFDVPTNSGFKVTFDNRVSVPVEVDNGRIRFRFAPRDPKVWSYVIECTNEPVRKFCGEFTAVLPSPDQKREPSSVYPNWWSDDPDPAFAEGHHLGAKTVSRWRKDFLGDFATRMERCRTLPQSN